MNWTIFYRLHWQMLLKIQAGLLMISLVACTASTSSFTSTPHSATARPSATMTRTPSLIPTITQTAAPNRVGECPIEQPDLVPDFKAAFEETDKQDFVTPILGFLNKGGSPQAVVQTFEQLDQDIFEGDLTGDNVTELGVFDPFLHVLGCVNEKYEIFFEPDPEWYNGWSEIASTQDMNLDGVPELVVYNPEACGFMWYCSEAYIFEWDGQQFQDIVKNDSYGTIAMRGPFEIEVKDIDENGTQELVTSGGIPLSALGASYADGVPWRDQFDTYMWNGKAFVLDHTEFSPPQYRFQAVQDGDLATQRGEYKKALAYYEQAVFDGNLEWWTPARREYEEAANTFFADPTPTPLPAPVLDPAERPHLDAYAQYRIMLLYIRQDMMAEAQAAYDTLQKKFPEGKPGYLYAEMATEFWTEYQSSSDIARGCNKAINYAAHQPEIFLYLGNTKENYYHGWQSLDYEPKSVCPFSK